MIVLDVETTGLSPDKNSLVSIGAIDFDNPSDRFYQECRIWEGAEIDPIALLINGYQIEDLHNPSKKTEGQIVKEFLDWLENKTSITIAGENCYFDMYFVEAAAKRVGDERTLPKRIFDQHSVAYFHMLKRKLNPPIKNSRSALNSDAIMEYVGLPPEPKPHIAINGALWEYEAIYRLIFDKPSLEEFKKYKIPWLS